MDVKERMARHHERTVRKMARTVFRMMRDADFRNCVRVDYSKAEPALEPSIRRDIEKLLADPTVRHIDIPRKVVAANW